MNYGTCTHVIVSSQNVSIVSCLKSYYSNIYTDNWWCPTHKQGLKLFMNLELSGYIYVEAHSDELFGNGRYNFKCLNTVYV